MKYTAWEKELDTLCRPAYLQGMAELASIHPSNLDTGNPNHPLNDGIFCYETKDFMKRQYKTRD